jgi:hypothetical protein
MASSSSLKSVPEKEEKLSQPLLSFIFLTMHTQKTFLNYVNQWQCWHDRGATAGLALQRSSWGRECRWRKGFCASGPGVSAALPSTDRHIRILGSRRNSTVLHLTNTKEPKTCTITLKFTLDLDPDSSIRQKDEKNLGYYLLVITVL